MTYKILITADLSPQALERLESAPDITYDVVKGLTPATLSQHIPGYDGLIIDDTVGVTVPVLDAATQLKVVGRAGPGVDNIDTEVASLKGIIVMNTPGANSIATAEHTLSLLLALCRHVPQAHDSMLEKRWDRKRYSGVELHRKTIGIIGLGRIGARVALRCQAFDMKVLVYDPYINREVAHELNAEVVNLPDLYTRSDFITLHATLTDETRGMLNAEAITQMKTGVRIVNTARGALIDEQALIDGVEAGKIAGAALDVVETEPLPADHPFMTLDNIIVTPNLAASTVEAQRDVSTQIVDQVLIALRGEGYRNAVNVSLVEPHIQQSLEPYLALAEKIGSLQTQLADEAIRWVEVEVKGHKIEPYVEAITVAVLKGVLTPVLHQGVNYVNAPLLARRRGITVSQASGLSTQDYPNLISCRMAWAGYYRTVVATLFSEEEPRLVRVDGYRVDVRPEGTILVTHSHDRPGFIGTFGTMLGEHGINIATWRTGRTAPNGLAISFISVDQDVPADILDELRKLDFIWKLWKVQL